MSVYNMLISDVNTSRGAPMGRPDYWQVPRKEAARFNLMEVRLNGGGYDRGGAYWGHGVPLYVAYATLETMGDVLETIVHIRALSRERAKEILRKDYPNARFYR